MIRTCWLVLCCSLGGLVPVHAKIINPITLEQVVKGQPFIFTAKISEVLPDKPGLVFVPDQQLQGKFPFERVPVNLTGDAEANKEKQTAMLLERVASETILVVFADRVEKTYSALAFTDGTWFSLQGTVEMQDGKEVTRWRFTHAEPYLRRTFKGTTAELIKAVQGGLKGEKLPPFNAKEEPGYGPPLKKTTRDPKDKKERPTSIPTTAVPIGVIQLPFLGLIAALAALFPALFGGLAIFMKRWVAALSAASTISLFVAVANYFPHWLAWSGVQTLSSAWFVAAGLTALFALWAGVRYRRAAREGRGDEFQPRYLDRIGMAVFVLLVGVGLWVGQWLQEPVKASPWLELAVLLVPLVACLYFVLAHWLRSRGEDKPVGISAETVGLWAGVGACVVAGMSFMPRGGSTVTVSAGNSAIKLDEQPVWVFEPKEAGEVLASPCVTDEHVFVNVHHRRGFSQYGRVYCLNRETGAPLWDFADEGRLKPLFCSPVYANGSLYFGEGYHTDRDSKLFCLDAKTGAKRWEFETTSHTESTPSVAEGVVVFGAGDDGVYCLDANTGAKRWQHKGTTTLHVDANPLIHEGRVYVGSGTSQKNKINRILCLDLKTGDEVWGEKVEYSAWGSPTAVGKYVYFATGNGTYSEDRPPVTGLVLCREAATGKPVWERALPNSVVAKPAVDRFQLYVGCRDGLCYALDRFTGDVVWTQTLHSPVLAAPVVAVQPQQRIGECLYVMGSAGTLLALAPHNGSIAWGMDFRAIVQKGHMNAVAIPGVVREEADGKSSRRIFIGIGFADTAASTPTARLYCYRDRTGD